MNVGNYTIGNYKDKFYYKGSKEWLSIMDHCIGWNNCYKYCTDKEINDCELVNYTIRCVQDGMI